MTESFFPYQETFSTQNDYAEDIRTLRANIMKHVRTGRKCLLVTSSWPDEGKSTTCLALGCALAEFNQRVLLIDGDLRQATLTGAFRLKDGEGTTADGSPLSTPVTNLWFAPAGELRGSSIDLLVDPKTRAWLATQREDYDVVLLDSPPMSACSDALLWGASCDGAIFVCSGKKFRGVAEGNFCEDLRDQGIEILGIVVIN